MIRQACLKYLTFIELVYEPRIHTTYRADNTIDTSYSYYHAAVNLKCVRVVASDNA